MQKLPLGVSCHKERSICLLSTSLIIDGCIVAILGLYLYIGWSRGVMHSLLALAGTILAITVASQVSDYQTQPYHRASNPPRNPHRCRTTSYRGRAGNAIFCSRRGNTKCHFHHRQRVCAKQNTGTAHLSQCTCQNFDWCRASDIQFGCCRHGPTRPRAGASLHRYFCFVLCGKEEKL